MQIDCLKYIWRIKIQEELSIFEKIARCQKNLPIHEFTYSSFEYTNAYKNEIKKYVVDNFGEDFKYKIVDVQKETKVCRCEINSIEQIRVISDMYDLKE